MSDEVQRSLGRVESKIDMLLDRHETFDKRLGSVEKKVYWFSGASAFAAYLVSTFLGKH